MPEQGPLETTGLAPSPAAKSGAGDAALGLVAAIESQLSELRRLANEHNQRTVDQAVLETKLAGAHQQLAEREAECAAGQAEVGRLAEQIRSLEAQLSTARQAAEAEAEKLRQEMAAAAETHRLAAEEAKRELAAAEANASSAAASAEQSRAQLESWRAHISELEHLQAKHGEEFAALEARRKADEGAAEALMAELQTRLDACTAERDRLAAALATAEAELLQLRSVVAGAAEAEQRQRGELDQLRAEIQTLTSEASAASDLARATTDEAVAVARRELEAIQRQQRDAEQAEHRTQLMAAERQRDEAEARLGELEGALGHVQSELGSLAQRFADLVAAETDARERLAQSQGQLAEARERCEELGKRLASAEAEGARTDTKAELRRATEALEQQRAEFEQRLARTVEQIELAAQTRLRDATQERERLLAEAQTKAKAQLDELREEASKLRASLDAQRLELETTRAERDQVAGRLAKAATEGQARNEQQAAGQTGNSEHAASLQRELDAAQAKLTALTETVSETRSELQATERLLNQREDALRVLAQRLLSAEEQRLQTDAELENCRRELAKSRSTSDEEEGNAAFAPPEVSIASVQLVDEFNAHRRARLNQVRAALNLQSRKLLAVKAALERKNQQCEEVLTQRKALSETAAKIDAERKRIDRLIARNRASTFTFFCICSLIVIGAIAWNIGGMLAPATYAVRTSLRADMLGREATAEELATWTSAHQKLVSDPEVITLAASRFAQRGLVTLGTPAALKQRLDADLTIIPDQPGRLTLELRGEGRERTEREMETFVLAVAASANGSREARGDGAASIVAEAPKAGNEPLKDPRLMQVLSVGGIGAVLASLLTLLFYRVVVRGKQSFEKELKLAENSL